MTATLAAGLISFCVALNLFLFITTGDVILAFATTFCAWFLNDVARAEMRHHNMQKITLELKGIIDTLERNKK
jgi:Flp pilus assembly protein TadB